MVVIYETVSEWVERFLNKERATTNMISPDEVLALCLSAVRKYMGHGRLNVHIEQDKAYAAAVAIDPKAPHPTMVPVDKDMRLSTGEWGAISPLFQLYVEREQATQLEATRMMGGDPFGRTASEIASEIRQYEDVTLPRVAFFYPVITV